MIDKVEQENKTPPAAPTSERTDQQRPVTTQPIDNKPAPTIPIPGRFDQYRSSYWAGAIAAIGARYAMRPFERDLWKRADQGENIGYYNKNKYSGAAGAIMWGVTGFYATRTWKDIKNIFSEAVAWETGKNEKDVGFFDFWKSKNTMVQQTINNYVWFNVKRFAVNTAFFLPFIPGCRGLVEKFKLNHPETGVDFGVAANAAYLFSDVMSRKSTPFEGLQSLIDRKINQAEQFGEQVTGLDLLDVYERHAKGRTIPSFMPMRGTVEWNRATELFDRMGDLINQTYKNVVPREKADFGFSKFIYMIGRKMIDPANIERSHAYVEIANQYGVKEVEKVAAEIGRGVTLENATAKYSLPSHAPKAPEPPKAELAASLHGDKVRRSQQDAALANGLAL